jgi:phospholipid transport system substrate-binding protein
MQRVMLRATASLFVLAIILVAGRTFAGPPTDQLKSSVEQVIKVLEDPALKADPARRRVAIREVASKTFDFGEAARRSLGRHWQNLSEADRQEFTGLFTDLLERGYIARIEEYSGEKIAYTGDTADGDAATVKTRFTTNKGTDIPVDYRMLKKGDRWLVYDVSVEGLSLIGNYRGQFNKIIETSSFQDLLKRMKARTEEFGGPGAKKKES